MNMSFSLVILNFTNDSEILECHEQMEVFIDSYFNC